MNSPAFRWLRIGPSSPFAETDGWQAGGYWGERDAARGLPGDEGRRVEHARGRDQPAMRPPPKAATCPVAAAKAAQAQRVEVSHLGTVAWLGTSPKGAEALVATTTAALQLAEGSEEGSPSGTDSRADGGEETEEAEEVETRTSDLCASLCEHAEQCTGAERQGVLAAWRCAEAEACQPHEMGLNKVRAGWEEEVFAIVWGVASLG